MTPDRIRQIFKRLETGDGAAFFGSREVATEAGIRSHSPDRTFFEANPVLRLPPHADLCDMGVRF
jgi:hypothetical protein